MPSPNSPVCRADVHHRTRHAREPCDNLPSGDVGEKGHDQRAIARRFSLGLGTGWLELEHQVFGNPFPPLDERFGILEEALGYVRSMLDGDMPGFQGETFRLEAFPTLPRPTWPTPLVVGSTGTRRTSYLAGTYADEDNCYPAPA